MGRTAGSSKKRALIGAGVVVALVGVGFVLTRPSDEEPTPQPDPGIEVRAGVGAVFIEEEPGGDEVAIEVRDGGDTVGSGKTDRFGGLVIDEDLEPQEYGVWNVSDSSKEVLLANVTVLDNRSKPPAGWDYGDQSLLEQSEPSLNPGSKTNLPVGVGPTTTTTTLAPGAEAPVPTDGPFPGLPHSQFRYGYLTTRDGTELSYFLILPESCKIDPETNTTGKDCGPDGKGVPTLLDYSPYDPSDPTPVIGRDSDRFVKEGYASLGVNFRGTACSGGAVRKSVYTDVDALDGYDAVETIAAQPWSNGRVGMTGHSGPGQSQWNVARTNPPHLLGITPGASFTEPASTVWPGGIENLWSSQAWGRTLFNGHLSYLMTPDEREQAVLAEDPEYGFEDLGPPVLGDQTLIQVFVRDEAKQWLGHRAPAAGDEQCARNQRLRGQNLSVTELLRKPPDSDQYTAIAAQDLSAIKAPVLIVHSTNDELSGTSAISAWNELQPIGKQPTGKGDDILPDGPYPTMVTGNGDHDLATRIDATRDEVGAFLDVFVAGRVPQDRPCADERYQGETYQEVLDNLWENDRVDGEPRRPIRVLGEVPASYEGCGPRWERDLDRWPPEEASGIANFSFRTSAGGLLLDSREEGAAPVAETGDGSTFTHKQKPDSWAEGPITGVDPDTLQFIRPQAPAPEANGVTFTTTSLDQQELFLGPGTAHIAGEVVRGEAEQVDLEVVLWEVTKENKQVFMQAGWKRADVDSKGRIDTEVEILDQTHLLHAGSQLRMTVSAPGYSTPGAHLISPDQDIDVAIDTTKTSVDLSAAPDLDALSNLDAEGRAALADPTVDSPTATDVDGITSLLGEQWVPVPAPVAGATATSGGDGTTVSWTRAGGEVTGYTVIDLQTGAVEVVGADGPTSASFDGGSAGDAYVVIAHSAATPGAPAVVRST